MVKNDELMRPKEAAEYLRIAKQTLVKWTKRKINPVPCIRIGPRNDRRFWKSDIIKLLEKGGETYD